MSSAGRTPQTALAALDAAVTRALADLDPKVEVRVLDESRRTRVAAAGRRVLSPDADRPADVTVCVDGEMEAAGEHAESLLAELVDGLVPGGTLLVGFANAFVHLPAGSDASGPAVDGSGAHHPSAGHRAAGAARTWRPGDVRSFLGARGVALEHLVGPGAAAWAGGRAHLHHDPVLDAEPTLLGAAPTLLATGRTPGSQRARSDVFFATVPRKTVAAATVTRRSDGSVLMVYDSFKQHWTIPGGLVDHDEDPRSAALRETREESGVDVVIDDAAPGAVFHALHPDRLIFVYRARPLDDEAEPSPVHGHEIAAARWMALDEALHRVPPWTAEHITGGLEASGRLRLQR